MPRCHHHLITSKSWDMCPQPANAHTECGPLQRFPGSSLSPGSQSSGVVWSPSPTPPHHPTSLLAAPCVLGPSLSAPRGSGMERSSGKIWGGRGSYSPGAGQRNPRSSLRGSFQVRWLFPPSGLPSGPLPLWGCRLPRASVCELPSKPGPLLPTPPPHLLSLFRKLELGESATETCSDSSEKRQKL